MLRSSKPVVAVCAVRTGSGKSQTTRYIADELQRMGHRVVAIRHPMPYGDLVRQRVQRFATYADLDKHETTIEEREEYEPHIDRGIVVYAGVDYEAILRQAEQEADVILWDGGNNDLPFYKPDVLITVADPHRAGHELTYYPGAANFRLADVIVINKVDTADLAGINAIRQRLGRQPRRHGHRGRLAHLPAGPGGHPRQARAGHRGRPHPHPWRDEVRCRHRRRPPLRRRRTHRPAPSTPSAPSARPLKSTRRSAPPAGDGLWRPADQGPEETIRRVPCDLVIAATPIDLTRRQDRPPRAAREL